MPHQTVMGPAPRALAVCLTALCAFAHVTAAQTTPPLLTKGAQVRVVVPAAMGRAEQRILGTLVRLANDTVVVAHGDDTSTVALYRRGRVEVRTRGSRAGEWTLFGAVGGFGTAFLIGWAVSDVGDPAQNVVFGALAGGVVGALAGRLIGASVASEAWTRVQTAGVQITMTPRAVGISVAF